MNRGRHLFILGFTSLAFACRLMASEPSNEAADLNRYQIIIDRSPFGQVSGSGPALPLPNFATRFQFAGLVSSNNGPVQAILFDKEANRTYFCIEGEVIKSETDPAGVTVVQIEQEPSPKVVLKRGLEPATLRFEERASTPTPTVPGLVPAALTPGGVPAVPQPGSGPRRIPFRRTN